MTEQKKYLNHVVIAAPCPVSWESMEGDDRVRHCGGCCRDVYNISDMSSKEAERFLEENGSTQCMRLYRRPDGTVMTDNCPRALRAIRNKCRLMLRCLSGLAASFFAFMPFSRNAAGAQNADDIRGDVYVPPKIEQKSNEPRRLMGEASVPTQAAKGSAQTKPAASGSNHKTILMGAEGCSGTNNKTKAAAQDLTGEPMPLTGSPLPPAVGGQAIIAPITGRAASKQDPGPIPPGKVLPDSEKSNTKSDLRDSRAQKLFYSARENAAAGKFILAQTQYEAALKAANEQSFGDPQFRALIKDSLNALRKKMNLPLVDINGKPLK